MWNKDKQMYESKTSHKVGARVQRDGKNGTVTKKYSRKVYKAGSLTLGPYPELYEVTFDDGTVMNDVFWYGITPIN